MLGEVKQIAVPQLEKGIASTYTAADVGVCLGKISFGKVEFDVPQSEIYLHFCNNE